jgi:hypothetical protein
MAAGNCWDKGNSNMTKRLTRKMNRKGLTKVKRQVEKEMAEKIGLFNQIQDQCLICHAPFDKKNKEQVQSWYVIVRKEENRVNLYCPPCWSSALNTVKELEEQINRKK